MLSHELGVDILELPLSDVPVDLQPICQPAIDNIGQIEDYHKETTCCKHYVAKGKCQQSRPSARLRGDARSVMGLLALFITCLLLSGPWKLEEVLPHEPGDIPRIGLDSIEHVATSLRL